MACRDTPLSVLPRNTSVPFSHGFPHPNPGTAHHSCIHAPPSQCIANLDLLSMLRSRVAVLEEQLANVNAQKESADTSNRYLLRFLSAGDTTIGLRSTSVEVSELRQKLLVSKAKKNQLKAELQKALLLRDPLRKWPCQCCRTLASTESNGSSTAVDCQSTGVELHLLDSTGPVTDPLIDLTDLEASTSAEGTPELDQCDGYSSASDDSEELLDDAHQPSHRDHTWGLGGVKHNEFRSIEVFPKESSYVRHFSTCSGGEITARYDQTDVKTGAAESSLRIGMPTHSSFGEPDRTRSSLSTVAEHNHRSTFLTVQESASTATAIEGITSPGLHVLDGSSTAATKRMGKTTSPGPAVDKVGLGASNWNPSPPNRSYGTTASEGPAWGVGKLFGSAQEREIAISIHKNGIGPSDYTFTDMFKYGICYSPGPSVGDVYRTISISGLASTVTMNALLEKVRGGVVVSVKLLDTITITGSHTALITFLHERAAVLFEDYAIQRPLILNGSRVKVELLSTPTWPMPISLQKAIYEHGHTRCLTIRNFPRNISSEALRRDLRVCLVMVTDCLESVDMRSDGVLELRFESTWMAGKAYGILTSKGAYRKCKIAFSPDPCAEPLDILDEQTGSALDGMTLDSSEAEIAEAHSAEEHRGIGGGSKGYTSGVRIPALIEAEERPVPEYTTGHHSRDGASQEPLAVCESLVKVAALLTADARHASLPAPLSDGLSDTGSTLSPVGEQLGGIDTGEAEGLSTEVSTVAGV